ncbi:hypothetical protein [Sporosarcina sp. Te-1]|uniref:hypothetical protein n=1 Tax=Sporosarcina sp. Te-1 TaxID=2818390 RepID=UPI001A9DA05D|nr:hypothetical protein [Sporosarcina sp. Te-1]QTD40041.1 hypothetical protein J3U78_14575 [Sporosarcina sp. Te-1]
MKFVWSGIFGVSVWLIATLFFMFLGEHVLIPPGAPSYWVQFLLLEAATAVLLFFTTFIYIKLDRTPKAAIRFAVGGTIIGLFLDSLSISYHAFFFSSLDDGQLISFVVWLCTAYALYLFVPLVADKRLKKREPVTT